MRENIGFTGFGQVARQSSEQRFGQLLFLPAGGQATPMTYLGEDGRQYLLPWLMQTILVGRCHRITVLDGVWNDFADEAGFDAEARQSVRMGFDGKTLIHPKQVAPANRWFSPDDEALAEAARIVAAFDSAPRRGANVINLDGRMVERLHLEQAQRLLAIHAAIAARSRR